MNLCVSEIENHEHGVGPGVNTTLLSDSESETDEDGVGADVNVIIMSDVLY